jgi:hypothetical protein
MTDAILSRFHGALVDALRDRNPDQLSRPFTVAEIYQDLVPYGAYRDVLGVEMNGDYEHALLRLLAGEGDFVEMESEHALHEIREELESVNPNTGLYREFAAVDVRLNPAKLPADNGSPVQPNGDASAAEAQMGNEITFPPFGPPSSEDREETIVVSLGDFAASDPLDPEIVDDIPAQTEPEAELVPQSNSATDVCRWCRETLPKRDHLNFCPFCGTDVKLVPCDSCGEALEADWRFCIACGARAAGD